MPKDKSVKMMQPCDQNVHTFLIKCLHNGLSALSAYTPFIHCTLNEVLRTLRQKIVNRFVAVAEFCYF